MNDLRIPFMAVAALAAGPALFWKGFRVLRTARLIENTPTARVRSMAMGLVEVHGKARARSQLLGPFSGRACAYWEVDVSARNKNGWTVLHRAQSGQPFFLDDGTGVAMVFPHGADCRIRFGTEETCFGLQPPSPYAEYLHDHPGVMTAMARLSNLRFRERLLEEGQEVYIMGTAGARARAGDISDDAELAATGTDGLGERHLRELDSRASAVIRRGENEATFIISQEQERDITVGLKLKAAAMLFGGPPLALFGLGYWLMALATGHRG